MGTLAPRGASLLAAALFTLAGPTPAAANPANAPQGPGAPPASRAPAIQEGHDGRSAWMVARFRQLVVTKRFDSATRTALIELRAGADVVQLTIAPAGTSVTRHGHTIALEAAESIEPLQQLLGGSMAVFATREMLSQLESDSALEAADMALLSTAAFVASLVGDVSAPRRLADRFVAKHRGIFQRIGAGGGRGTCWQEYTVEVTDSWNELQECMEEAEQDLWWWAPIRRLACNGVWLLRSESAWFEYLKCISPVSTLQP
jgi:hypothetical protein